MVVAGDAVFNGGGGLIGLGWDDLIGDQGISAPFLAYQASGLAHSGEAGEHWPVSLGYPNPVSTATTIYSMQLDGGSGYLTAYRREKLAAVYPLTKKDRAAAGAEATLWTNKFPRKDNRYYSIAAAGPQSLVAGVSEVFVLDETGQKELATFKGKGTIRRNGLSVAQGRAYIVTEEGTERVKGFETTAVRY